MKLAVITPHWNTPVHELRRNMESVAAQKTSHEVHHFLVADGYACSEQDALIKTFSNATHIQLPVDCNDAGATPFVVAAYVARALGCTGYFGIGDDNIILPDHVESCVATHLATGAEIVASERFFMTPDGERLEIPEEQGHIDCNCLAFFGDAERYLHMTSMMPRPLLQINDRVLRKVFTSRFKLALTNQKTVGYATKWANHYRYLGREVPTWAKENTGAAAETWLQVTPEAVRNGWFEYLWQSKN